jgi:hypothetical protein
LLSITIQPANRIPRPSPRPAAATTAPAARPAAAVPLAPAAAAKPGFFRAWASLFGGLFSGRTVLLPGVVRPYPTLTAPERRAAEARGQGRTIPQAFIASDPAGHQPHEPVNLVVTGSLADLTRALEATGWVAAAPRTPWNFIKAAASALFRLGHYPEAPVSAQLLNGQAEVVAFNKQSDHNLSRDHMRVYRQGTDPASGQPIWAIAATRDTALSVAFPRSGPWPWQWKLPAVGHAVDPAIDHERDLIMRDLLASGHVTAWASVNGQRPAGLEGTPLPTGDLSVRHYRTDGRVYEVRLGG